MGLYFNQTFEEKEYSKAKHIFCVVIYDIVSNKRRLRLAKILEAYGIRVQKSCFEIKIEKKIYRQLLDDLESFFSEDELDNIIVYKTSEEDTVKFNYYESPQLQEDVLFL